MSDLQTFMAAIRQQESGGNYGAYNAGSGAAGAYQFTYGTWQYAMGLAGLGGTFYANLPANDAPASVQDAAAAALMSLYYNDYGHSWYNVAEAWYGGPGAVGHPNWGGGPGYPTVGQYADSVIAIYNRLGGSGGGGGVISTAGGPANSEQFGRQVSDYYRDIVGPPIDDLETLGHQLAGFQFGYTRGRLL